MKERDEFLVAKRERTNGAQKRYSYEIDGSAAIRPELQPAEPQHTGGGKREISRKRARQQSLRRKLDGMAVREQSPIALTSVIGMVAVALLAAWVIGLRVQLNTVNTELSECSTLLSELKEQEDSLLTQYEQMFDMGSIESSMLAAGKMTKPSSEQTIYLELADPDNAVTFENNEGVLETLKNKVLTIVEYFR